MDFENSYFYEEKVSNFINLSLANYFFGRF
jgi:hypothetical protein